MWIYSLTKIIKFTLLLQTSAWSCRKRRHRGCQITSVLWSWSSVVNVRRPNAFIASQGWSRRFERISVAVFGRYSRESFETLAIRRLRSSRWVHRGYIFIFTQFHSCNPSTQCWLEMGKSLFWRTSGSFQNRPKRKIFFEWYCNFVFFAWFSINNFQTSVFWDSL